MADAISISSDEESSEESQAEFEAVVSKELRKKKQESLSDSNDESSESFRPKPKKKFAVRKRSAFKKIAKPQKPGSAAAKKFFKNSEICETRKDPRTGEESFYCIPCEEFFETGQALGGHMSRCHPGQSDSYARKVQRRKEREPDRELLRLAKEMHARNYGTDAELDRVKIRRYKKLFRKMIANKDLHCDKSGRYTLPSPDNVPQGMLP